MERTLTGKWSTGHTMDFSILRLGTHSSDLYIVYPPLYFGFNDPRKSGDGGQRVQADPEKSLKGFHA